MCQPCQMVELPDSFSQLPFSALKLNCPAVRHLPFHRTALLFELRVRRDECCSHDPRNSWGTVLLEPARLRMSWAGRVQGLCHGASVASPPSPFHGSRWLSFGSGLHDLFCTRGCSCPHFFKRRLMSLASKC